MGMPIVRIPRTAAKGQKVTAGSECVSFYMLEEIKMTTARGTELVGAARRLRLPYE